jgi:hypothetical protein
MVILPEALVPGLSSIDNSIQPTAAKIFRTEFVERAAYHSTSPPFPPSTTHHGARIPPRLD